MTTAVAYITSAVPKGKLTTTTTPNIPFIITNTPAPIAIVAKDEYTDDQFHADLKKASKWLKAMAADASREYAEGKTEIFPK